MGAVALDLTPVVRILLESPFDGPAMERVRASVDGHPQAYATALRCAAKRTKDPLAAAYWLTEAARVHESVDDLGGAIALFSRAWECDPGNPRIRELLAGCMARLGVRVGLGFVAACPPVAALSDVPPDVPRGTPLESGLRPPPLSAESTEPGLLPSVSALPPRDTLPGLFGNEIRDADDAEPDPALRRTEMPDTLAATESTAGEASAKELLLAKRDSSPPPETTIEPVGLPHRPSLAPPTDRAPPPLELASDGAWPLPLRRECRTELPPPPGADLDREREPLSRIARIAAGTLGPRDEAPSPTRRSSDLSPMPRRAVSMEPPVGDPEPEDAYGEVSGPPTERPVGDRLMGVLFEALHALHFFDDVKGGAVFVGRVIAEKMKPRAAFVHLYDINSRKFVIVSALGNRAEALVDCAIAEDEPLVAEVMKEDEATLVLEPASDPRFARGRWLLVEPRRSVLCAPAMSDGRFLGLIEIADPTDGSEFTEDDRNALTYVATAFARFLDRRGVVLSESPSSPGLAEPPPPELATSP